MLRSAFSDICTECTVRGEWPLLPARTRAEFDRLVRAGRRIQAVRVVLDGSGQEPKPGIRWATGMLVFRSKALGVEV